MRIPLLFTVFLSALFSFSAITTNAQNKKKIYTAKVSSLDRKAYHGILKSADDKGIYLVTKKDTAVKFIAGSQIRSIKIKTKNSGTSGFLTGAALGLAAGATGVYLADDNGADKGIVIGTAVGGVWLAFITGAIGAKITGPYKEKIYLTSRNGDYLEHLNVIKSYSLEELKK